MNNHNPVLINTFYAIKNKIFSISSNLNVFSNLQKQRHLQQRTEIIN